VKFATVRRRFPALLRGQPSDGVAVQRQRGRGIEGVFLVCAAGEYMHIISIFPNSSHCCCQTASDLFWWRNSEVYIYLCF